MNIEHMTNIEYNYVLEIDNIKRSYFLTTTLQKMINTSNISTRDKRRLKAYNKDFKLVCRRLIKRKDILNYDIYKTSVQTLIIINAKSSYILNKYNIKVTTHLKNLYDQIYELLPLTKTTKNLIGSNYKTIIIISIVLIISFGTSIFLFIINNTELLVLSLLFDTLLLTIAPILIYRKIQRQFKIERINRILNGNLYNNRTLLENARHNLIKIIYKSK